MGKQQLQTSVSYKKSCFQKFNRHQGQTQYIALNCVWSFSSETGFQKKKNISKLQKPRVIIRVFQQSETEPAQFEGNKIGKKT